MFKRLDDYERMLQTDTAVSKLNVIYASINFLYTVDNQLQFKQLMFKRLIFWTTDFKRMFGKYVMNMLLLNSRKKLLKIPSCLPKLVLDNILFKTTDNHLFLNSWLKSMFIQNITKSFYTPDHNSFYIPYKRSSVVSIQLIISCFYTNVHQLFLYI